MNLALRLLSPAGKCVASGISTTNGDRWDDKGGRGTSPVHGLVIGGATVRLDLLSGVGYEREPDRSAPRRLSPAESRLVLLDWTRKWMPLPSPGALWVIEAASLAAMGSAPHWREWAMPDLHAALLSLLNSPVKWTDEGRNRLVNMLESMSCGPASVDSTTLDTIVREVGDFVALKAVHTVRSIPAPASVVGCSEVEWDRVEDAGIDIGELGLRSRIFGTVWTASIGRSRFQRRQDPMQLWARLVDDESGAVHDEAEMRLVDGVLCARGYRPASARRRATRVDLTANLALPARSKLEREHILADQAWFRLLHFERLGSTSSSWAPWCEVYRGRLAVGTPGWVGSWARPFLAERHLRPIDLASGRTRLVSPDPNDSAQAGT